MKVFITGSSDGLGLLAATKLIQQGQTVVLHARNSDRASQTREKLPSAEGVLIADLSSISETINLAKQVNSLGPFDAVIYNAGIKSGSGQKIFTVNSLAPYILTSLIKKPQRLIYLSSGMHSHGSFNVKDIPDRVSYSDSKLHNVMLSKAVARKWSDVYSNSVNPGWVPTKMGGRGAPDDLQKGAETQAWLAVSNDASAQVSGKYFFHQTVYNNNSLADDQNLQDKFLEVCESISGVHFPIS